jgi:hypothetical protein
MGEGGGRRRLFRNFCFALVAAMGLARPAMAQNAPMVVPCARLSAQAVSAVPAPFDRYMRLICYNSSGQGLVPPAGTGWVDGNSDVGLSAMDDRPGPNGQPRLSPQWYVSLTVRAISAADDAALRHVLASNVQPQFIVGSKIIELDAMTSAGELKQEFLVLPGDAVATHGIKLLMECHSFCGAGDTPWILGVVSEGKP